MPVYSRLHLAREDRGQSHRRLSRAQGSSWNAAKNRSPGSRGPGIDGVPARRSGRAGSKSSSEGGLEQTSPARKPCDSGEARPPVALTQSPTYYEVHRLGRNYANRARQNITEVAPVAPTKNMTESCELYRAAVKCRTLRHDGHALTRAVPGHAAGRLMPGQQETEDAAVERGAQAHPAEPEGADRQGWHILRR
jgi:hypothetical protein